MSIGYWGTGYDRSHTLRKNPLGYVARTMGGLELEEKLASCAQ